jgi:hypothetical protein
LVVQTRLVAGGRTDLHRAFGAFGAALAIAMVALGTLAALIAARRPTGFVGVPMPPLQFLAVPIAGIALFAGFVARAVAWRRNPQTHKRLMLLATLNLVTPALARWPGLGEFGRRDSSPRPICSSLRWSSGICARAAGYIRRRYGAV